MFVVENKNESKIKPRNNRRKGIPLKQGSFTALDELSASSTSSKPTISALEGQKDANFASDSEKGNGDCQLSSSSALKFLLQMLNNMSSPSAIPLYTGRYPPLNGYGPAELPLDCRKVDPLRRYVWAFHKTKMPKPRK